MGGRASQQTLVSASQPVLTPVDAFKVAQSLIAGGPSRLHNDWTQAEDVSDLQYGPPAGSVGQTDLSERPPW